MRRARVLLIAGLLLGVAGIASAGQMALTQSGDLYRVVERDRAVVVEVLLADGTSDVLTVPQSPFAVDSSLQVGVDGATGALFVLWQRKTGMDATLRLATYIDGTWIGPETIAGNDGTAAFNPQLLVQRVVSEIIETAGEGAEPVVTELATTFLHIVWWSATSEDDPGVARLASIPVGDDGTLQLDTVEPAVLSDLLPYGFACFELAATDNLKHPLLFLDPQTGNPCVFAADLEFCLFRILDLQPEVVEEPAAGDGSKRRRHITVWNTDRVFAMRKELPLATARIEVGSHGKVLMHWDENFEEESILKYLELDTEGISETHALALGENLSHEQAVDLIRGLTR